jgi:hypothetical protein
MGQNSFRGFLFLVLLSGLVFSCTRKVNNEEVPPDDLIHRDTMVNIIVDLRIMDALVSYEQRQANRKITEVNYFIHASLLNKYNITRDQFERSFKYYQSDLETIDKIFADVITKLSKMKSEIEQE